MAMPSDSRIVPQKHSRIAKALLGSKIQPIPDKPPESPINGHYFSRITFSWLDHLLRVGYDRVIVLDDIPEVAESDALQPRIDAYREYISRQPEDASFREIWGLLYAFRYVILTLCCFQVVMYAATVSQSVVSRKLITEAEKIELSNGHMSHGPATGYTIGNTALNVISVFSSLYTNYRSEMLSEQIRVLAIYVIHEKVLKLSPQQRLDFSTGKVISILSSDSRRAARTFLNLSELLVLPFYLGAVIGILIWNIGVSGLAGIALLLLALGLSMVSAVILSKLRSKSMPFQDKRVSLVRETVKNMSIIKFYGWENSFLKMISAIRMSEARYVRLIALVQSFMNSLIVDSPMYAGALAFSVRIIIGKGIQPQRAFPSLQLFSMFLPIFATLTMSISAMADAWVAAKRINQLFRVPEIPSYIQTIEPSSSKDDVAFELCDATFGWNVVKEKDHQDTDEDANAVASSIDEKATLDTKDATKIKIEKMNSSSKENSKSPKKDGDDDVEEKEKELKIILSHVNVRIQRGALTVVVGPVASGKTSLLSAFVGNIPLIEGAVRQAPATAVGCVLSHWSRNATIKDNITFGHEWDEDWYDEVIDLCDLHSDFEQFTEGDLTEVGENGVTLSGGQRARLALARCVYADTEILVLDDILSAMDARVANVIFRRIQDLVRQRGKTVVFSTNNLRSIDDADSVISLTGKGTCVQGLPGEIPLFFDKGTSETETYESSDIAKNDASNTIRSASSLPEDEDGPRQVEPYAEHLVDNKKALEKLQVRGGVATGSGAGVAAAEIASVLSAEMEATDKEAIAHNQDKVELMEEESRATGSVQFAVLSRFFQLNTTFGIVLAICAILVAATTATSRGMSNVVMNWWTSNKYDKSEGFNIGMYCLVLGIGTASYLSFANIVAYYCTNSSTSLFRKALGGVYGAPMLFFQRNPLGRIMTRFTEDLVNLDTQLLMFARAFFIIAFQLFAFVIVVFVYVPWSILCLVPIITFSALFLAFYRTASRELNRVKQLCESKVMTIVSEDVEGQDVIVAFGQQRTALNQIMSRGNVLLSSVACNIGSHFWMALRDSILCEILTLITIFLAVYQVIKLNASDVGMLLSTLPNVTEMLAMAFPIFAMLENQLNSVERLDDYAFRLEQERRVEKEDPKLADWTASAGEIEFEQVCLRYREDLPLALDHLSFHIGGGKRLGICGRTGAGKSTIISAIFRLAELSEGTILIDGQKIDSIPLEALRKALAIIPQQPVLFQGTIRSNLDPFEERTDQELWEALNKAGKLPQRDSKKFHLDSTVDTEGTNFSLGERQMLSLARALVKHAKILVLDEATAAVDEQADAEIQEVIKTQFSDCTVLCIAHRLNTIIDYDEIMVMGPGGKLLEVGQPSLLLQKEDGEFAAMAREAHIL